MKHQLLKQMWGNTSILKWKKPWEVLVLMSEIELWLWRVREHNSIKLSSSREGTMLTLTEWSSCLLIHFWGRTTSMGLRRKLRSWRRMKTICSSWSMRRSSWFMNKLIWGNWNRFIARVKKPMTWRREGCSSDSNSSSLDLESSAMLIMTWNKQWNNFKACPIDWSTWLRNGIRVTEIWSIQKYRNPSSGTSPKQSVKST